MVRGIVDIEKRKIKSDNRTRDHFVRRQRGSVVHFWCRQPSVEPANAFGTLSVEVLDDLMGLFLIIQGRLRLWLSLISAMIEGAFEGAQSLYGEDCLGVNVSFSVLH